MALVGVIANPAAGRDIRRLVAQGRVVPDWEKVNIIRRALLGVQSVGVGRVLAMPDSSHLVLRAAEDPQVWLEVELLRMPALFDEGDTERAAGAMAAAGVGCVITLGGDGTNRAAAKGARDLPLVAVSTGTNNVFPAMVEGTTAGMAAGLVALGAVPLWAAGVRSKTLTVLVDGAERDLALVDVALSKERFVATRAIWDMGTIYEVFLTRAEPGSIGLSSIGGRLEAVSLEDEGGLYYRIADSDSGDDGGVLVRAPVAPGSVQVVGIGGWRRLGEGERVGAARRYCTVALDGERAFSVGPDSALEVVVRRDGPPVVGVEATLRYAAAAGGFYV